MQKPLLAGIRVLDLGRFIAAPYAGQLLADLGADVVRVERPRPEPDRERGPYLDGQSLYFVTLNRGKRSVAFDMFSEAGRQLLDALIARADVLIQNYSPRTARDLGVGDDLLVLTWLHEADRDVQAVHPRDDRTVPERGVFSTRSPDRPNPIGVHRVEVVEIDGLRIRVRPLEAIDGTPVVDVKPVLRGEA